MFSISEIQRGSSILRVADNGNSSTTIENLTSTTRSILVSALSPYARSSYKHSRQLLLVYRGKPVSLPLITIDICNFIAFLFEKRYSSGSNVSHISALGYVHQILNMPSEI